MPKRTNKAIGIGARIAPGPLPQHLGGRPAFKCLKNNGLRLPNWVDFEITRQTMLSLQGCLLAINSLCQ